MIHECVVIPDFGALIIRKKPAFYSDDTEKFFPPSHEVAFNRNINKDDGLLANHIAGIYGISFAESRELIRRMVKDLEIILKQKGSVLFDGLGRFTTEGEDVIVFSPAKEIYLAPGYYGFPVITVSQLDEYKKKAQIKSVITRIRISPAAIAAGIALFLTFSIIPLDISRQSLVQQQKAFFQLQSNPFQYNADSRDSVSSVIDEMTLKENALAIDRIVEEKNDKAVTSDTLSVKPLKEVESEKAESAPAKTIKPVSESGYYLIAGSFVEMWRAESFIKELDKKGFSSQVVNSDNKLRVSVFFSDNKTEADSKLAEMRVKNPEMPVWLLKK